MLEIQVLTSGTPIAAVKNKVYQFLTHGRLFSPGTTVSSTTKTVRHDIAEILLSGVKTPKKKKK
jgi:hypothetical protein